VVDRELRPRRGDRETDIQCGRVKGCHEQIGLDLSGKQVVFEALKRSRKKRRRGATEKTPCKASCQAHAEHAQRVGKLESWSLGTIFLFEVH
jgi:hypothetical protein